MQEHSTPRMLVVAGILCFLALQCACWKSPNSPRSGLSLCCPQGKHPLHSVDTLLGYTVRRRQGKQGRHEIWQVESEAEAARGHLPTLVF